MGGAWKSRRAPLFVTLRYELLLKAFPLKESFRILQRNSVTAVITEHTSAIEFCIVNAHDTEEMRQNECKRNQKDDFSKQCTKEKSSPGSRPRKELCTPLCSPKNCHAGNVNRKYLLYDDNQFRVSREKTGKKSRTKHCEYNVDESGRK